MAVNITLDEMRTWVRQIIGDEAKDKYTDTRLDAMIRRAYLDALIDWQQLHAKTGLSDDVIRLDIKVPVDGDVNYDANNPGIIPREWKLGNGGFGGIRRVHHVVRVRGQTAVDDAGATFYYGGTRAPVKWVSYGRQDEYTTDEWSRIFQRFSQGPRVYVYVDINLDWWLGFADNPPVEQVLEVQYFPMPTDPTAFDELVGLPREHVEAMIGYKTATIAMAIENRESGFPALYREALNRARADLGVGGVRKTGVRNY